MRGETDARMPHLRAKAGPTHNSRELMVRPAGWLPTAHASHIDGRMHPRGMAGVCWKFLSACSSPRTTLATYEPVRRRNREQSGGSRKLRASLSPLRLASARAGRLSPGPAPAPQTGVSRLRLAPYTRAVPRDRWRPRRTAACRRRFRGSGPGLPGLSGARKPEIRLCRGAFPGRVDLGRAVRLDRRPRLPVFCLSVSLSVSPAWPSASLSRLPGSLSVSLPVSPPLRMSLCLSASACLYACLSASLPARPSLCLSARLSVCLSLCMCLPTGRAPGSAWAGGRNHSMPPPMLSHSVAPSHDAMAHRRQASECPTQPAPRWYGSRPHHKPGSSRAARGDNIRKRKGHLPGFRPEPGKPYPMCFRYEMQYKLVSSTRSQLVDGESNQFRMRCIAWFGEYAILALQSQ